MDISYDVIGIYCLGLKLLVSHLPILSFLIKNYENFHVCNPFKLQLFYLMEYLSMVVLNSRDR